MGWTCVLAEKPSVARDIARVLGAQEKGEGCLKGNGYVVTWALGHLITQCNPDEIDARWKAWRRDTLPILPEEIPLKVVPTAAAKKQFAIVKKILNAKQVDRIVCATDAGREGELIFRRIYAFARCKKPVFRLWISSMTEEAIAEGFARLAEGAAYDGLYASALCRSEADWLVGMNGSRAFTLRYDSLLSVGRVQTPTLSLLVRRAEEIERFVPEAYFEVCAQFSPGYKGTYLDGAGRTRIPTREEAERIAQAVRGRDGRVESVDTSRQSTPPPLLYDLTTLQREANARYGLTAQATLDLVQALYEKHKVLTYPRTDSRHLPHDMRPKVQKVFATLPDPYRALVPPPERAVEPGKRVFDDAKITDHHAIVPTGRAPGNLSENERRIYDLVVRQLLAAFHPPMQSETVTAVTNVDGRRFRSTGKTILDPGWQAVKPPLKPRKQEEEQTLPPLHPGQEVHTERADVLAKHTEPPKPYTENTLLAAMENAGRFVEDEELRRQLKDRGLGTPATRAAILERLIEVGYVQRAKKALLPTEKGRLLISVVPEQLSSPETTGRWEKGLADIARGQMDAARFMESIRRYCAFLCTAADSAPPAAFPPSPPRKPVRKRSPASAKSSAGRTASRRSSAKKPTKTDT
ncbi:MAG: DNA topoisomerase III [Candidatus Spyradocola sp.]|jgi:DNA topoisomerase-3